MGFWLRNNQTRQGLLVSEIGTISCMVKKLLKRDSSQRPIFLIITVPELQIILILLMKQASFRKKYVAESPDYSSNKRHIMMRTPRMNITNWAIDFFQPTSLWSSGMRSLPAI
jgi:hypothetical protein